MQPGEYIRENTPVATIVQMNPLKLKTAIQEKHASLIRPGQAVEFNVEAFLNRKFKGKIAYVSPAVDQATRTFAVEALVENTDRQLKPGFFAKGVVLTKVDENVLAVPEDAISTLAGVSTVYVIEDGKARQQQVTLGARQDKLVEITSGLKGDETLATTQSEPARDRRRRCSVGSAANEVAAERRRPAAEPRRERRPPRSASMRIAEVSVKRPVFAIMMTAALIVLGAVSYESLGLDLMPKTDAPVVIGPGQPARRQRRGNRDADHQAHRGSGQHDQRHRRAARLLGSGQLARHHHLHARARHRIGDAGRARQAGADRQPVPARHPAAADHRRWIPTRSRSSASPSTVPRAPKELTEIAEKRVKQELETVKDVGSVGYNGERKREIQLLLERRPAERLRPDGRSGAQRGAAAERRDPGRPVHRRAGRGRACARWAASSNVEDFNRIVISYRADGSVITFADVGRVQDSVQEVRSATRLSGTPAIGVQVRKQSGTNTVEVVDRVQERLTRIQAQLPQDIQISIGNDQSRFIRRSFEDIKLHLILGGLLASVVVFLFIRNLRVTFIAALAIPTSIIGTFTFMKMAGFTLNNMTMLALSLATGIVIDDAIVVLENIFRFVEEKGVTPKEAAADADAGDRPGGHGDDAVAGRDLRAGRVHDRPDRPLLLQLRPDLGGGDPDVDVRVVHAHAGAVRDVAEAGGRQGRSLDDQVGGLLREDRRASTARCWCGRCTIAPVMMGIAGVVVAVGGVPVSVRRQGAGARRRPGRVQRQRAAAARHELSADRGVHQADREGSPRAAGAAAA